MQRITGSYEAMSNGRKTGILLPFNCRSIIKLNENSLKIPYYDFFRSVKVMEGFQKNSHTLMWVTKDYLYIMVSSSQLLNPLNVNVFDDIRFFICMSMEMDDFQIKLLKQFKLGTFLDFVQLMRFFEAILLGTIYFHK